MDFNKLSAEKRKELAKKAKRIQHREWLRKNPEKVKEYNERYWAKKAAAMMEAEEEPAAGVDG